MKTGAGPRGEVLVVGAGPAGSSLALRLARAGVRVRLLDARSFPRSKPCGDCLSPGAAPLLRELGVLERIAGGTSARLAGWRLRTPGGVWFRGRFPDLREPALSLPRRELDAALVEAAVSAGAALDEGVRVFGLLREGGGADGRVTGVRVRDRRGRERTLRAPFVVGADGLRSVVARRLSGVRRGARERLALVGRFRLPPGPGAAARRGGAFGEMRLSADGCLGLAPLGGGRWNATLVVPARRAGEISGDRRGFYRRALRRYGVLSRLEDAEPTEELEITGPFEISPRRTTAPGVLLVGDAAGYFDPLTGQGVFRALATARLAARCLVPALERREREEELRRRYEAGIRRLLAGGRRVQRLVDAVVTRPRLMDAAGRLLRARPGLASLLVGVTGDIAPPGALLDPRRLLPALLRGAGRDPSPARVPSRPVASTRGPEW